MARSIRSEKELRELGVYLQGKLGKVLACERLLRAYHFEDKDGEARTGSGEFLSKNGHSDPTALVGIERAEGAGRGDVTDALRKMVDGLFTMARQLDSLEGTALTILKPPKQAPAQVEGCRSCQRLENRWAKVYAKGLCRWCYDHAEGGLLPAREAVDLMHRQSGKAADAWIQRNVRRSA